MTIQPFDAAIGENFFDVSPPAENIAKSKPSSKEKISSARLKKLDSFNTLELQNIKKILLESKISAYQEQNLDRIRKYIIGDNK